MSDQLNSVDTNASTAVGNSNTQSVDSAKPPVVPNKVVSWEDHQAALNDLQKHKKEAQRLKEERENQKIQALKEKEDWKAVAEAKEREAIEAKERADKIQNSYLGSNKFNAVKDAAVSLGLLPAAIGDLENLDLSDIQIETTSTGRVNVLGAKAFAEKVKTLKPHWFQGQAPSVNTSAVRVLDSEGPITGKELYALEQAYIKSGKPEDKLKYTEAHSRLVKQRR